MPRYAVIRGTAVRASLSTAAVTVIAVALAGCAATAPEPEALPPGVAVELFEVQTTNLLQFDSEPTLFAINQNVKGTDAATTVTVPILPLRCDPHAVMEDKRGTVFNVAVEVGGAEGVVEVAASEEMRGVILRWVSYWCGFGSE